jgi:hypothetical protein
VNRATLQRRLDALELQLGQPPSFASQVLETATDEQLDALEAEIVQGGGDELWAALVAAYKSEVSAAGPVVL